MEESSGRNAALLAKVEERLQQSEKSRTLFRALVQAQERGGAREVKDLVTQALKEEMAVRAQDTEVEIGNDH